MGGREGLFSLVGLMLLFIKKVLIFSGAFELWISW